MSPCREGQFRVDRLATIDKADKADKSRPTVAPARTSFEEPFQPCDDAAAQARRSAVSCRRSRRRLLSPFGWLLKVVMRSEGNERILAFFWPRRDCG
jgi:hypothetical protein